MCSVRAAKTKYLLEGNKILSPGQWESQPVNKNTDNLLDLKPSTVAISIICMLAPVWNIYNAHHTNPSQEAFKSFTILLFTDEQQQCVQDKSYLRLLSNPEGKWGWNYFLLMFDMMLTFHSRNIIGLCGVFIATPQSIEQRMNSGEEEDTEHWW